VLRPFSLSAISILAVLYGALSLIPKISFLISSEQAEWARELVRTMSSSGPIPLPSWLHVLHGLIGSVVWVVAGIFLWKGRNWSRWLVLFWGLTVLLLTFSVYAYSGPFLWKFGTYLMLIYYLLKKNSREYFEARVTSKGA
jgi:hypothetical protein